jgi:hypothetical protein
MTRSEVIADQSGQCCNSRSGAKLAQSLRDPTGFHLSQQRDIRSLKCCARPRVTSADVSELQVSDRCIWRAL